MKKMRRLIPAIAMLLVSAVMLSTASFAWFTMGTQATADGISVTATADSTLLIIDGDANGGVTVANFLQADGSITFGARTGSLIPATHDTTSKVVDEETGEETDAPRFANGLKTVADAQKVNNGDGKYDGATNGWATTTENTHYFEYVAVIGAAGNVMEDYKLEATVTLPGDVTALINNAVTVDFWLDASSKDENAATYVGSTNFLTLDADGNNKGVITLSNAIDIPLALADQATVGDYITVIMRVYFDGALECTNTADTNNNGKTYVRNALVSDVAAQFSVAFDVTAPAPAPQG